MIKPLIFFLLFFTSISAGEIDGKGVICLIYGNTVGFFFEDSRAYEHKPKGGKKKLELQKKEIGKYYTDENFIYFGVSILFLINIFFDKSLSIANEEDKTPE